MTDNRTNEPTEAMILAGLNRVDWDAIRAGEADPREAAAHAIWHALQAAAQEAAPQAESKCQTCSREASFCAHCVAEMELAPVLPSSTVDDKGVESGDYILGGVYHRVTDEGSIDPVPTVAMSADLWAKFETKYGPAVRVSAVQSSDVDEDALAEVILAAEYAHRDEELRANRDIGTLAHYQARAVAEWLKEQGR